MEDYKIPYYVKKKYSIEKKLGEGSFGEVYLANSKDGYVVLKFIFKEKVREKDIISEYELKNVLKERCKENLVCYHKLLQTDDTYVLVMDFINGNDLYMDIVVNKVKFNEEQKIKITSDLIRAIKSIHSMGLVHRDVKHENVVYDANENYLSLIDYGFTCNLGKIPNENINRCRKTDRSGTLVMLEPDIIKAMNYGRVPKKMWKKSDMFSVGLILYTVWTGDIISGKEAVETPSKVIQNTKDLPNYMKRLIFSLLMPPNKRVSSKKLMTEPPFVVN